MLPTQICQYVTRSRFYESVTLAECSRRVGKSECFFEPGRWQSYACVSLVDQPTVSYHHVCRSIRCIQLRSFLERMIGFFNGGC
jgi:hypothetical protein